MDEFDGEQRAFRRASLLMLALLAALVLYAAWLVAVANAHGSEQWIADAGLVSQRHPEQFITDESLTDVRSGTTCCGPSDCHAVEDRDVTMTTDAVVLHEPKESPPERFPTKYVQWFSPDGRWHRCGYMTWVGDDHFSENSKCLIGPPKSASHDGGWNRAEAAAMAACAAYLIGYVASFGRRRRGL